MRLNNKVHSLLFLLVTSIHVNLLAMRTQPMKRIGHIESLSDMEDRIFTDREQERIKDKKHERELENQKYQIISEKILKLPTDESVLILECAGDLLKKEIAPENAYGVIYSLSHGRDLENNHETLEKIFKLLKPNGIFLVYLDNPDAALKNKLISIGFEDVAFESKDLTLKFSGKYELKLWNGNMAHLGELKIQAIGGIIPTCITGTLPITVLKATKSSH
jgi:SAM-dependent methyltransferase